MRRALFVISALFFAVGCGHLRFELTGFSIGGNRDQPVRSVQELPLGIDSGETLDISTSHGSIEVVCSPEEAPMVRARLSVQAEDEETGAEILDRFELMVESTATGIDVSVRDIDSNLFYGKSPSVSYEVRIPGGVRVRARSNSGHIRIDGPVADCDATSGYGDVRISQVTGDVVAVTGSGDIEVGHVRGSSVEARSGYGDVRLDEIDGDRVEAKSSSGDIALHVVKGSHVEITSSYGNMKLEDVSGRVAAATSSGSIHARGGRGEEWSLRSGYGDIDVNGMDGDLRLKSSSGDLEVHDFSGSLEAQTGYGSVLAAGTFDVVNARSSSGSVHIKAGTGSAVRQRWLLQSGYGDIELTLPQTFSCDLEAQTSYGKIRCDHAITLQGTSHYGRELEGRIGGGGGKMTLKTSSGSVSILKGAGAEPI